MFALGILKATGSVFKTDFTAFPFIDVRGRHTISTVGTVTSVSSKAYFNNANDSAGNRLIVSPSLDFDLSGDFDLSFKVSMSYIKESQTMITMPTGNQMLTNLILVDYFTVSNRLRLIVRDPTGILSQVLSLSALTANVEYYVKVKKTGNTYSLFINNVYQGEATTNPLEQSASRYLILGGSHFANYGLFGTLDSVDFKIRKIV